MSNELDEIIARVKKKSPAEQAKFRRDVFRELELLPMRMILKDVNRTMSPADWLAMRSWVMGVEGAAQPDFVVDDTPRPDGLEKVRLAIRRVLESSLLD